MESAGVLARGQCDEDDRLITADDPLAGLQARCGGQMPGAIAVPELRDLVSKARRYGLKLARPILAQDGEETIRAWVEVHPHEEGQPGCHILIHSWQTLAMPPEETGLASRRRAEIDRALAELVARLDARQGLLAVECEAVDLAEVAERMRTGLGRPWTDFVDLPGNSHHQPLHWRLLDGAMVRLEGSARSWRASLAPQAAGGGEPSGFTLYLTSTMPAPSQVSPPPPVVERPVAASLIGQELAPVLRQPISRIIANAETIRARLAGPLPDEYAQYAADIAVAGEHLQGLVDDLADMEVIEAEGFTTAGDLIDLADVARRAAGILSVRARDKGITLVLPQGEDKAPAVAEFRRVLQILLNLIGNSIRYSRENSLVYVEAWAVDRRAILSVRDEGPGIAPADRERVFDKFERLGRSNDGGSGLGLYISRRLARAMAGDLRVDDVEGQGACFLLDLPAQH